jgi:HemY protein
MRAITKNSNQGWSSLIEGDWSRAEACMLKAAKHSENPVHFYLAAAKAEQELGMIDRRDDSIRKAMRSAPQEQLAIGLVHAELQLKQGQLEQSLATLHGMAKLAPYNTIVLRLSAKVASKMGDWQEVSKLLHPLRKYEVLPAEEIAVLEAKTYASILQNEAKKSGKQALLDYWETLPKNIRYQSAVVQQYAQLLLSLGAFAEAEQVIRNALRKQWDVDLVKLYGLALGPDLSKQISTAEGWLRTTPGEPALLLTLARLCLAHKLWGKARNYLDACIALEPNADAYAELGRLLGFLGEQQKALECYKKGLLEFANVLPIETAPVS